MLRSTAALIFMCITAACGEQELTAFAADSVHGRVVDWLGEPLAGVQVTSGPDIVTTDANGEFEVERVGGRYDLVVAQKDAHHAALYEGLTTDAPTLTFATMGPRSSSATLTWHDTSPKTDTEATWVVIDLRSEQSLDSVTTTQGVDGQVAYVMAWMGAATVHAHALRYERDPLTLEPIRYLAYATLERALAPGHSIEWTPDWQEPSFAEATVEVSVTASQGFVPSVLFDLHAGERSHRPMPLEVHPQDGDSSVSVVLPVLAGMQLDVSALVMRDDTEQMSWVTNLPVSTQTVQLEPPAVELLGTAPKDRAKDVGIRSKLIWSNPASRPVMVRLWPSAPENLLFDVVTDGESVVLPSLARFGLRWPARAGYTWMVARTDADTVDDLALRNVSRGDDFFEAMTPRTFTTR